MNSLSKHPVLLILFTLFLLAGCGGGGGGGSKPHTEPPPPSSPPVTNQPITENGADLSNTGLTATQAQVFELLKITGLPEGSRAENFHGEYKLVDAGPIGPGIDDSGLAPIIEVDGDDDLYLLAPLVDPEGATINVRISDGASYSRTLTLAIAPLPEPESGALEKFLGVSEQLIKATAEAYGLVYPDDLQGFIGSPQSLPPQYVPLVHGYHVLANPNNPARLKLDDFTDEERRDLERLIGHMNLVQELERLVVAVSEEQVLDVIEEVRPYVDQPGEIISPNPSVYYAGAQKSIIHYSAPVTAEPVIWRGLLPIDSPEDLAAYMAAYNRARETQQHIEAGVTIAGTTATAIGVGAAFVASGPGGSAAVGSAGTLATAKAAGTVITVVGVANGAGIVARGFFPCCIHDIAMELIPESGIVAQEDAAEPSLILDGAKGVVRSEGVDLTKQVLERAINIIGAGKVSNGLQDRFAKNVFAEELIDAGTGALFDQLDLKGNEIIFEWRGVDLAGDKPEEWLQIDLEGFGATRPNFELYLAPGSGRVDYRLDAERFFGNEHAQDILRVRPKFEKYPLPLDHPGLPSDTRTVGANTIEVHFEPAGIRLDEPGEVVPFTVTVNNASNTDIELPLILTPEIGAVRGPLNNSGSNGVYEFEYVAPADELPSHSVYVHARATSKQGVRSRGEPTERQASMRIGSDDVVLTLTPSSICLDSGDTHTFKAVDPLLGTPVEVSWSVDIGSITSNGNYTAVSPRAPGYATITATATADSDVTATAQVTLGCDCWWSGNVTGQINQSHSNDLTAIFVDDDGAIEELMFVGRNDVLGTRFALDSPIPLGQTGTYSARSRYGLLTTNPTEAWYNQEQLVLQPVPPLQVSVDRHEMMDPGLGVPEGSRILEMRVTGTVVRDTPAEEGGWTRRAAQLSLSGRGSYWYNTPVAGMINCSRMP